MAYASRSATSIEKPKAYSFLSLTCLSCSKFCTPGISPKTKASDRKAASSDDPEGYRRRNATVCRIMRATLMQCPRHTRRPWTAKSAEKRAESSETERKSDKHGGTGLEVGHPGKGTNMARARWL